MKKKKLKELLNHDNILDKNLDQSLKNKNESILNTETNGDREDTTNDFIDLETKILENVNFIGFYSM